MLLFLAILLYSIVLSEFKPITVIVIIFTDKVNFLFNGVKSYRHNIS